MNAMGDEGKSTKSQRYLVIVKVEGFFSCKFTWSEICSYVLTYFARSKYILL